MFHRNGMLIQGINDKYDLIKNFQYMGMNAFYQYPLNFINDVECKKLTQEQMFKETSDNGYLILELISDVDLYVRFIKKCAELHIDVRILFVESNYTKEIWNGPKPTMQFLGYEYCPFPIDNQIITDLDWHPSLSKYWSKLNEHGLFNTYDEVKMFVDEYNYLWKSDQLGDGDMEAFICRISQVCV